MTPRTPTPEERAREIVDALDTYGPLPRRLYHLHLEAVAAALASAESRGFDRGLEAAEKIAETMFRSGTSPQLRPHLAGELIASQIRALRSSPTSAAGEERK